MIPRTPEAEALSALLRRNQDPRTPSIVDRTPTSREAKRKLWQEAKLRAAAKRRIAQQGTSA